jgi:hypothetical protein
LKPQKKAAHAPLPTGVPFRLGKVRSKNCVLAARFAERQGCWAHELQ